MNLRRFVVGIDRWTNAGDPHHNGIVHEDSVVTRGALPGLEPLGPRSLPHADTWDSGV